MSAREDVYAVLVLLTELDRTLHPHAAGGDSGGYGVEQGIPPPLPPTGWPGIGSGPGGPGPGSMALTAQEWQARGRDVLGPGDRGGPLGRWGGSGNALGRGVEAASAAAGVPASASSGREGTAADSAPPALPIRRDAAASARGGPDAGSAGRPGAGDRGVSASGGSSVAESSAAGSAADQAASVPRARDDGRVAPPSPAGNSRSPRRGDLGTEPAGVETAGSGSAGSGSVTGRGWDDRDAFARGGTRRDGRVPDARASAGVAGAGTPGDPGDGRVAGGAASTGPGSGGDRGGRAGAGPVASAARGSSRDPGERLPSPDLGSRRRGRRPAPDHDAAAARSGVRRAGEAGLHRPGTRPRRDAAGPRADPRAGRARGPGGRAPALPLVDLDPGRFDAGRLAPAGPVESGSADATTPSSPIASPTRVPRPSRAGAVQASTVQVGRQPVALTARQVLRLRRAVTTTYLDRVLRRGP